MLKTNHPIALKSCWMNNDEITHIDRSATYQIFGGTLLHEETFQNVSETMNQGGDVGFYTNGTAQSLFGGSKLLEHNFCPPNVL